jgi:hypothetical protein
MPFICDKDAAIFRKACIPALENFTDGELYEIGGLAERLEVILDAVNQRLQDRLERGSWR